MFRLVSAHDGPPECVVCFGPIDLHDKDDPAVSLSCDGQHIIHKYCWDKNAEIVAGRKCTCDEEPCCCRGVQCPLCRKPCDAQLLAPPSPGASSPASTAMAAGADAVASAVGAELSEQGAAETSVEPAGADAVPELAYKPQASGGTQFADNTGVRVAGARRRRTEEAPPESRPVRRRPAPKSKRPAATARRALGQASGVSPDADTSAKAAGAARVRGVAKTSTAKARGVSTQGGADDRKKLHKPVCKRPARESSRPAATARPALGETSSVRPAAGTSAAVADYPVASKGSRGRPRGSNGPRRVDKLDAKYPWGREGGPPPASEAELQSLAEQMARLQIEAGNFARSRRADDERLAHAEAMLHIMRGKARAGFGGGRAVATHGLSLNRSAGLALAKRARKLALDLEAHFDPKAAPSVLIEEGIALLDAD